jgi:hypothetical protein
MIDEECAICNYLEEAKQNLKSIGNFVLLTCTGKTAKKDFGLYLKGDRGIQGTLNKIKDLIKFHRRFHANCEEDHLNDDDFGLQSQKPAPRRWRKPRT